MGCCCGDKLRSERPYLVADERRVTGTDAGWRYLLAIPPEDADRHVLLESVDCSAVWSVVRRVDRVEVRTPYRTTPLRPAWVRVPAGGAVIEYRVTSIEPGHVDPVEGGHVGPAVPRVLAVATDSRSVLESEPYAITEPEPETAPMVVYAEGAVSVASEGVYNTELYTEDGLRVPPGRYRAANLRVCALDVPYSELAAGVAKKGSTAEMAAIVVAPALDLPGTLPCAVAVQGDVGILLVDEDGLHGRIWARGAGGVPTWIRVGVDLEVVP